MAAAFDVDRFERDDLSAQTALLRLCGTLRGDGGAEAGMPELVVYNGRRACQVPALATRRLARGWHGTYPIPRAVLDDGEPLYALQTSTTLIPLARPRDVEPSALTRAEHAAREERMSGLRARVAQERRARLEVAARLADEHVLRHASTPEDATRREAAVAARAGAQTELSDAKAEVGTATGTVLTAIADELSDHLPPPAEPAPEAARPRRVGVLAPIIFAAAVGLTICVIADALSRATQAPPSIVFWVGLLLIVGPIAYRLTVAEASPSERLGLVCLLGMTLYAVKVARDPFMFTYPDESVHAYNALEIARHGRLFGANPILRITPYYPGLEGATSALMAMTGMSVFAAGVVLIAAARLVMMIGLFALMRLVGGSARLAGLATVVYAGQANFLFFSGQYSYESLALPLAVALVVCAGCWMRAPDRGWMVLVAVLGEAVAVTHHLTSYAVVAALLALAVIHRLLPWRRERNPWPVALLVAGAAAAWFVVAGPQTIDYLSPVVGRAFGGFVDTVTGSAAPRRLFADTSGAPVAPVGERVISFASVLVLAAGLAAGCLRLWRQRTTNPFVALFVLAGATYFAALALRFASDAWEVGNRASGYLFLGLGFVVAVAIVGPQLDGVRASLRRPLITAGLVLIVIGGVILGWPSNLRLSQPLVVRADGGRITSETLGMAEWVRQTLPGRRFAATEADGRMILSQGHAVAVAGARPDVRDVMAAPILLPWQVRLLRDDRLRYVVADRRRRSTDNDTAPYFAVEGGSPERLRPAGVVDKYEAAGADRLFDSGRIVIFDAGAIG